MAEGADPTFYRSPAAAIAAPSEKLAYVAALDAAGSKRDAMTVVDCDAEGLYYLFIERRLDGVSITGDRALVDHLIDAAPQPIVA